MLRLTAITLMVGLLEACSTAPGPSSGKAAAELNYVCDDFTAIAMHPGVDAIAVLRSGLELRLPQYPGFRFTNGSHEFRSHGLTGTWAVPQRAPVVCRLRQ